MSQTVTRSQSIDRGARRSVLVEALFGLTGVAVLLQGLWAGIFLEHDGQRDAASGWIDVHARGGEIALVLAVLATIVAFLRLRARRDLWIGGAVLVVLLAVEGYLGGAIRDDSKDTLTSVHVPLALAIMALVVCLWLGARRGGPVGVSERRDARSAGASR